MERSLTVFMWMYSQNRSDESDKSSLLTVCLRCIFSEKHPIARIKILPCPLTLASGSLRVRFCES